MMINQDYQAGHHTDYPLYKHERQENSSKIVLGGNFSNGFLTGKEPD